MTLENDIPAAISKPHDGTLDPRRWVFLLIFFCLPASQCVAWSSFSTVPLDIAQQYFTGQTVSEFTVNLFLNWGMIMFFPFLPVASVLLSQRGHGLLLALRLGGFLVAAGSLLRCFHSVWCAHAGQILIGAAGPFVWNACASFSNAWFPPEERVLATAIGGGMPVLGQAIQFLCALYVVDGVTFLMMLQAEAAVFGTVALLVFLVLPAGPSQAPTASAAAHNLQDPNANAPSELARRFFEDHRRVVSNWDCWLISFAAGMSPGIFSSFASSMPIILHKDEGKTLSEWLGFLSIAGNVVGAFLIGLASDRCFPRQLKYVLVVCIVVCLVSISLFSLAVPSPFWSTGLVGRSAAAFQLASMGLASVAIGGVFPLGIELAAELAYPAEESTVVGMLGIFMNLSSLLYVAWMDQIPNSWVTVPMLVTLVVSLACVTFAAERYTRSDADEGEVAECRKQLRGTQLAENAAEAGAFELAKLR